MLIIPAIDLKDGHCVRLEQGEMDRVTVFSEDPAATARHWKAQGARRLHLVDLNGAFAGKPVNGAAIRSIVDAVGDEMPVQLGGGIRDLATIERYLDDGVRYVIIGTAAVKNPGFLHEACDAFPGHVMVGLDARDGKVAVEGWSKLTGHDVIDLAKRFEGYGVEAVIYTDIGRDGMLTGVDSVVVIDEAYIDFGGHSAVGLVARYPQLLVTRTLSKSHALAGLRVGYAIGQRHLIEALNRVKDSFNSYPLDRFAQAGALASMEDRAYFASICAKVVRTRTRLVSDMEQLGFEVLPSSANFIFARHLAHDGAELAAALRERSIVVRHFRNPARIAPFLRITIGTDAQCDALLAALKAIAAC